MTRWRYLIAFSEFGRISDVAMHFDVNASSVSRALKELETSLGQSLFRIEGRNLCLTQTGQSAVRLMKPAVELFDRQLAAVSKSGPSAVGQIRLSVAGGFADEFLLDYLEKFKKIHPQISFEIKSGQKIPALRRGTCDVVTVTGRPDDKDVVFLPRGINHYIPVASPSFIEKFGHIDSPSQLARVRVFAYGGVERKPTKFLVRGKEIAALEFGEYMRIDSISAIKKAVMQGKGICIDLPYLHCVDEMTKGELVPILSGWHRQEEELYVVTSRVGWKTPRIRYFAKWFASESQIEYSRQWNIISSLYPGIA